MKCPKCHYISFDDIDRCRNCGYDFSLNRAEDSAPNLSLRASEGADGPVADLPLSAPLSRETDPPRRASMRDRTDGRPQGAGVTDLPLFDQPVAGVDDTPLLTAPAPLRTPLAVRRSTTTDTPRGPELDPAGAPGPRPPRPSPPARATRRPIDAEHHPSIEPAAESVSTAGAGRRVGAALVDTLILVGIDAAVLALTLRLTGLDASRVAELPLPPLVAFLLLLDGGYLVGFTTASGQTIGKMLMAIRVVVEPFARVPLGTAVVRAAAVAVTVLTLGIGYVPALGGADRRALHDRLAGTRVVRR